MPVRPISVTVIAWILIVFGIFGVFAILFTALLWHMPLMQQGLARIHAPVPVQVAIGLAGVVIRLACGVALLFRQNWARFLYAVWAVFALGYTVVTSPFPLWLIVPSLVFTLVIVYFLFAPAARQYFTETSTAGAVG